jgi:hypothetical protein
MGNKPDLIIIDDVLEYENLTEEERKEKREKLKIWYEEMFGDEEN